MLSETLFFVHPAGRARSPARGYPFRHPSRCWTVSTHSASSFRHCVSVGVTDAAFFWNVSWTVKPSPAACTPSTLRRMVMGVSSTINVCSCPYSSSTRAISVSSSVRLKVPSLRQQQRFFLERYAPLFQLYHREQQSFPPLIQVRCTLCRILGALEQLLRETLFLFCPGQKLLYSRASPPAPGWPAGGPPVHKRAAHRQKAPPQAAGI